MLVNFVINIKISFHFLSSNSKIILTFAFGLLTFSFICHS